MPTPLFDRLPAGLDLRADDAGNRAISVQARGGETGRPAVPSLQDHADHRRSQKARGVDRSLIGPWIDMIVAPVDAATQIRLCRVVNEALAEAVIGEDRFLAALPDLDGAAAADVLAEALELGAVGGMLSTNTENGTLSRPDLDHVWGAAERLGAPIVLHPGAFKPSSKMAEFFLVNLVGNPFETTLAVGSLLGAEVPDRFGDLRLVLVHGGGAFPYQYARMDAGFTRWPGLKDRSGRPPGDYLRWFHYDTVLFDDAPTRYLLDLVGDDRVLAGSDCPFTMSDHRPFEDPAGLGLDSAGTARVLGGNAIALFGLDQG
jgi:aminocarboxymuconate-semialdehyde decarboxylase